VAGPRPFLAICANIMRRILMDLPRAKGWTSEETPPSISILTTLLNSGSDTKSRSLVAVDDALQQFKKGFSLDLPNTIAI
jgi:hypothetical protein